MRHHLEAAFRLTLLALALCCACAGVASAQEITGSIVGTVTDVNGAAVKGATVNVTDAAKKVVVRTVTTNDDGQYDVRDLPVTAYDVSVEAPSFKKHIESGVQVNVGKRRTLDIQLAVGDVAEVVTVEAAPVAVETSNATASTVITGEQARELSLNNRNWVQLITLAPGVSNDLADQVYVGTSNPAGQANTMNISVNGARSAQNTYTVDGADVTDRGSNITIQAYPSVDSIAEFNVQRSLFPAESGRSGGGQINVVTRSGGEEFHGTLYEFVRNERLNANDFISNRATNPAFGRESNGKARRAPFRYNDYGFTVGGPVYVPNFGEGGSAVKRVRGTFFFFSEEQRKDRRYPTLSGTVPDLNMRQGIFPMDVCLRANAPTATTATCLEVLPAGTPLSTRAPINPVAQQYLNFVYNRLPAPSDPVTRALNFPAQGVFDFRQEIVRLDHQFTSATSLYYRFEKDTIPTVDPNSLFSSGSGLPGVSTSETDSPGKTHTLQFTHVVNPNVVAVGRWNYGYGAILSHTTGSLALANSPITPPLPYQNTRDVVPVISGNGFSTLTEFGNYDNFSYKHNFAGDLTWTRGSHTMKVGSQFSYYRKNENALTGSPNLNQGQFSGFLNTVPTSVVQTSVIPASAAAQEPNSTRRTNFQAFANFLLGNNVTFNQARFDYTADLRQITLETYAQDEYKARPNLTLYYGLRHSYFGSPYDRNGRLSNFDPSAYNPAAAPQVTGAGNRVVGTGNFCNGMIVNSQNLQTAANGCTPAASPYGKYVVKAPKANFQPRVGLAWDPFGKGTTSIRMGYGMYYDQVLNGTYEQNIGTNPPYQETFSISAASLPLGATPPSLSQPVPTGTTVAAVGSLAALSVRAIQPNWKDPYMQHWSAEVQHQFTDKTLVSVGYFGSKGTHLIGAFELNELPPGQALNARCASGANTLQTPGVTTVPCQASGTYFGGTGGVSSNILDQIRPFRGYRSINMITPQFNSNYHSLQTLVTQRFSGASQVNVAYTWSKNLTDNQNDRSNAPENSYNIRLDRGRAALDRRHVFTSNFIYDLPFFKNQNGFAGKVLGGWEVTGVVTLQTGLPFTPLGANFDPTGLGNIPAIIAGNRPNLLCDPNENAPHRFEQFFNTQCLQPNPTSGTAPFAVGNGGRGVIDGPSTKRADLSLFKNFSFRENLRLQLRGEVFNVFNHTNFRAINGNISQATYGQVTSVRDPRNIQLGIKFYF
ncbi:MAG TPA: carboxypeptidase regulatory-like domain-containing protein [Pyrinomonadaceae bacterium]